MSGELSEWWQQQRRRYQPGQCPTCGALPGHQRPLAERLDGKVARAGIDALLSAADNMPISRPGQPYEHAAGWVRRRAEALRAALDQPEEQP